MDEAPNSPLKVRVVVERKVLQSSQTRFHLIAIRIANGYVNESDFAELFEDSLEEALAGLHVVVVFKMSRTEPLDWQVGQVHGVWPFTCFHLVTVFGVSEVRVPVVSCREVTLCLGSFDLCVLIDAVEFDFSAVESCNYVLRLVAIIELCLEPERFNCCLRNLKSARVSQPY